MAILRSSSSSAASSASVPEVNVALVLDMVSKEKGIPREKLIHTVEEAILRAAQGTFGDTRELEARFNPTTGQVDLFQYMKVVEEVSDPDREISVEEAVRCGLEAELNEELGFQIFWHPSDAGKAKAQDEEFGDVLGIEQARQGFGRIAAQTAKQVLLQRVREDERDLVFSAFKDRIGEMVRGVVNRFERGSAIIVDLGKAEGVLPLREQIPRENYRTGERITAIIKDVERDAWGPQVVLSRTDPRLVEQLFRAEVPEIAEKIVRIMACARDPGLRSKIAVLSRNTDIDPVGACVGMKGGRVQAVVQELRGEKIDIVPYDHDPARFVCAAMQPAEVNHVIVNEAEKRMELVVPNAKLSLAIGRKGQNVKLASQLTGWRLDVLSEETFQHMVEETLASLRHIDNMDEPLAHALYRAGFRLLEEIADASEEELAALPELRGGVEGAAHLKVRAAEAMEKLRQDRLAATHEEPETTRERLLLLPGVGERTASLLEEAGYKLWEDLLEENPETLAQVVRISLQKAQQIHQGVQALCAVGPNWLHHVATPREAGSTI